MVAVYGYSQTTNLISTDSRASNPAPVDRNSGLYADFKENATDGLNDGHLYHGVLTFRPYGSTTDLSGGGAHQLGFTEGKNVFYRYGYSSWQDWKKLLDSKSNVESSGLLTITGNGSHYISQGSLGIGTTTPQTKLNINVGPGGPNGTVGLRIGSTQNYPSLEFGIEGDYDGMIKTYGNDLKIYAGNWTVPGTTASENHAIYFYTSKAGSSNWNTAKMVLNHEGNVGIGTTDPVAGKIRAAEIKVEALPWSDFVFEPFYKLRDLKETEQFIKENKHLPEIPSAIEVAKDGINMGEMNAKLLQKIEEFNAKL